MTHAPTVCIVGLGLMGGSLALALRQTTDPLWRGSRIIAVGRNAQPLAMAQQAGAVDAWTTDLAAGVAEADTIVLAAPVRTILRHLPAVGRHVRAGALVLDMGSSKAAICDAMADLPAGVRAVGGHPMCGKETSGFAAAEARLYRDRTFVLCPVPHSPPEALEAAQSLVLAIGARPRVLDPQVHDRAVAAISHLPYLVAAALVGAVHDNGDALAWSLAASGFRDTSRLAACDPDMMLDILLTNREPVLDWLERFAAQLATLRGALAAGDETALRAQLAAAQARRANMQF